MPACRPERDALIHRLQSSYPDIAADGDDDIILWQGWRIHCAPLPSALAPVTDITRLELCQLWPHSPLNPGLLLAGSPATVAACDPLWHSLTGTPQTWLYCGPLGAAGFCKRVFDSLFYLASPALIQHTLQHHGAAQQADWAALLQQHQQLAERLQALCWQYLHHHGLTTLPQDAGALLALFRVPPQQQDHYALTLAQLLATALTLSEPARRLLAEWNPLAVTTPPVP